MLDTTFYFDPIGRWGLRLFCAIDGFLGFVLGVSKIPVHSTLSGHPASILLLRIGAGAMVVLAFVGWRIAGKFGVEATSDGICVRKGFGIRRRFVGWSEISTFIYRRSIKSVVCAELHSGGQVATPLIQGRKMLWQDGASRDIVGVLNADLARNGRDGQLPV